MTKEFEKFCYQAIKDATGCESTADRVPRAGDCSFANLGVGTYYMLLPSIPEDIRQAKRLYHVGGSGGNNEWHHEDDTIEVADKENLLRDTRIYVLSVLRTANAHVLPYDLVSAAKQVHRVIEEYASKSVIVDDIISVDSLDFTPALRESSALINVCQGLAVRQARFLQEGKSINDSEVKTLNEVLLNVQRHLVRVSYVRGDMFSQEPALEWPPVPDLAPVTKLVSVERGSTEHYLLLMQLKRGLNRVVWTLKQASKAAMPL